MKGEKEKERRVRVEKREGTRVSREGEEGGEKKCWKVRAERENKENTVVSRRTKRAPRFPERFSVFSSSAAFCVSLLGEALLLADKTDTHTHTH